MNKEERTKTLINNIKLNINEQNVHEFGLCIEQWKQILDYIVELQQENQKYKEVIDKSIKLIEDNYYSKNTTDINDIVISGDKLLQVRKILKGVE